MITAKEAKIMSTPRTNEQLHKEAIERSIINAAKFGQRKIRLPFTSYGYDYVDVEWLEKYGYKIVKETTAPAWEISW